MFDTMQKPKHQLLHSAFVFLSFSSILSMTKHRLAIIGKGLVASAIAKQAATTYGSVTMVSRSKPLEEDQLPDHVSHVQGNALHPSTFSDVIRSADAVVSTVGIIKENKGHGEDETFERLNRDAVVNVAREMVKTQPANLDRRCLVYFSAANAPPGFLLDPRYINTKREAEDALLSKEFKDTLRIVIVRPGKTGSPSHQRQ
jgi:nucleoside-diphosphate-sugar epimerase